MRGRLVVALTLICLLCTGVARAQSPVVPAAGGTITGRATDASSHTGVPGITVVAYDGAGTFSAQATTAGDGGYALRGLAAGSYRLEFYSSDGAYRSQYYNNKTVLDEADRVIVTAGQTTSGIDAALAPASHIVGAVRDAATGAPVGGVFVEVFNADDRQVGATYSSGQGRYAVGALAAGTYRITFRPAGTTPYGRQSADGIAVAAAATARVDQQLVAQTLITGTVTDATTHTVVPSALVEAYDSHGNEVGSAYTATDGGYAIGGLGAGNYRLSFRDLDSAANHAPQFYNNRSTLATADPVLTTVGHPAVADAALEAGGRIEGTVTDATTHSPVPNSVVAAFYPDDGSIHATTVDAAGHYILSGLPTGTVNVVFVPNDLEHVNQYYDHHGSLEAADGLAVTAGQTHTGIDAALDVGGSITGTVADAASGRPAPGIQVQLTDLQGAGVGNAVVAEDGTYVVGGLPAGSYRVLFTGVDPGIVATGYASQWYHGATDVASATAVTVTLGHRTTGVDAVMTGGGHVEGTITRASTHAPIAGAQVVLTPPSGFGYQRTARTAQDGTYSVGGLPSGAYAAQFSAAEGNGQPQYYNNKPIAGTPDVISVNDGATVTGIDAQLVDGAQIQGTVTDAVTHAGVGGVTVSVSGATTMTTTTASDGTYTLGGMPAGQIRVGFLATSPYARQYNGGAATAESAQPISVSLGSTVHGVDASLQRGATIAGRVTDAATGASLGGIVEIYDSAGSYVTAVGTDFGGSYAFVGLAAGAYRVAVTATGHVGRFYPAASTLAAATPVTVGGTTSATGIDVALATGATISGSVTDATLDAPVVDASVTVYGASGAIASGSTDGHGRYVVGGLSAGTYRVGFSSQPSYPSTAKPYVDQFYPNAATLAAATTITLTADQSRTEIDAALVRSGDVEGTLSDGTTHTPAGGVEVTAYDTGGNDVGSTTTETDGSYVIGGLPTGQYRLAFATGTDQRYVTEYYDGAASLGAATVVDVTAGERTTGIDANLTPLGSVAGTVTGAAGGAPLVGITVIATTNASSTVHYGISDSGGHYRIDGLSSGSYMVTAVPDSTTEYVQALVGPIVVTNAEVTSGVDFALAKAGHVTGTVIDATTHAPVGGESVSVTPFANGGYSRIAITTADGTYDVGGLAAGSYRVEFKSAGTGPNYVDNYYNGKSYTNADSVTVTAGDVTAGVDAALARAGEIDGKVVDARTSQPLAAVSVEVFDSTNAYVTSVSTQLDGTYRVRGLGAGGYRVGFYPSGSDWEHVSQFYAAQGSITTAQLVPVTAGAATTGIDAALSSGGAISGHVTDATTGSALSSVTVTAQTSSGSDLASTLTNSSGDYTIPGLPSGTVIVHFTGTGLHASQYYSGEDTRASADPVTVSTGVTTTGIDAALSPGAAIAGTVKGADADEPLTNVEVYAYSRDGSASSGVAFTDAQGHYMVEGLDTGSYTVEFIALNGQNYVRQDYVSAVAATAGQTTSGIDATLAVGGRITGTITDASSGQPVAGATVSASSTSDGVGYAYVTADQDGHYTIVGMPAGGATVTAGDPAGLHGTASTASGAVAVTAQQTQSGVDVALAPTGVISGRVRARDTGTPIAGVEVDVLGADGSYVTSTSTYGDGTYRVNQLPGGTYKVRFSPGSSGATYGTIYYPATATLTDATPVSVTVRQVTADIDGALFGPPVDITTPTVFGTAKQGEVLTEAHGSWSQQPDSYTYRWLRCAVSGGDCSAITGATEQTYKLTIDDAGLVMKVEETAANAAGSATPATSAASAVVIPLPPAVATAPTITGRAQQGEMLAGHDGTWSNNPTSFARQWKRCDSAGANCVAIGAATGATYGPVAADVGATLAFVVTASNAGGAGPATSSDVSAVVVPPVPTVVSAPTVTGTAQQGQTLREQHASWTNAPSSYSYRWQRCDALGSSCLPIAGATQQSYVPDATDIGATLVVREVATNAGGDSAPAPSAATAVVVSAPPVNQSAPAISGTAQQGQVLALAHGAWTNQPSSYNEQWKRCNAAGESCTVIAGATGQSYVPAAADVGGTLLVSEIATNAGGESAPVASPTTAAVTPAVPVTTAAPTITGTAQQGQTLNEHHGAWTNAPSTYQYQWQRCNGLGSSCLPIGGATDQTYVPVAMDVGATLAVTEIATNAGGDSAAASSVATAVVVSAPPVNASPPTVSGRAQQGQALAAVRGTWTNQPTSFTEQWERCDSAGVACVTIAGATGAIYEPVGADVGGTLAVREIATNAGGDSVPATSAPTAVVVPPVPVTAAAPTITGIAQQYQTLTEHHGTWTNTPTSYTYRWQRCDATGASCAAIAGATMAQYAATATDVGATLVVTEVAINAGGDSAPAASIATAAVAPAPPAVLAVPTVTGIAQQGQPLTEHHGTWTNDPTSYATQWQRCDATGAQCATIAGATDQQYSPTPEDVGHRLVAAETATNAGGDSSPAPSAPTAVVLGPVPTSTAAPTITGTAEQGETLTEHHGTWTNAPTDYTYQWERCDTQGASCRTIPGATGATYTAATDDIGARMVVQETATNGGAPSAPATSGPTVAIAIPALHAVPGETRHAAIGAPVAFDGTASAPRNVIDGYTWDFGDGSTGSGATASHSYSAAGTYTVRLTIADAGHQDTASTTVTVSAEPAGARVTVHAPDGGPLAGASLVYVGADGTHTTAATGSDGAGLLLGLPDGTDAVYAWGSGYQPAVVSVPVSGGRGSADVTLNSGQIATSTLTSRPMTLAEIEAAGIDPNDPDNQNVWTFTIGLSYNGPAHSGTGTQSEHFCGYLNSAGQFVGDTGFGSCGGGGGGGGGGAGGTCGVDSCRSGRWVATGAVVDGHPLIEWLALQGQVTTLKQFFSVDMIINNLSPEPFALTDGSAMLDLPAGLSFAPTAEAQAATQAVGTIGGLGSADVNWIIRGDQPGFYGMTARYQGKLQPFDAPVDLSATLAEPLHVWGPEALGLKVQVDSGTLTAGHPYHVRIGVINHADVPFYNVDLGIDPDTHDRFIFQPDEHFSDSLGALAPGETTYGHVYVLVPDADSAGSLLPAMSKAAFDGEAVNPGEGVESVAPPAAYALTAPTDSVGSVHLHWDPVPGAQGYEVFSTPDLDTPFEDEPDSVEDFGGNDVTRLPATATEAYISVAPDSARHYAVSTILGGRPTLEHAVVLGRPGVAAPPTSGGGGTDGTGTGPGGGFGAVPPGAQNDNGIGAPVATCANHSVTFGGVTILASCFADGPNGTLQAHGQIRVNGLDLKTTRGFTIDRKASELTASGTVDAYIGSMNVFHGTWPVFSLKLSASHTWGVPKSLKIKGLPVAGSLTLALNVNALSATATAQVGNTQSPFAISGTIDLRATLADGLKLDGFSLRLASDLAIKSLVVKQASLAYKATSAGDQWTGKVAVDLPSGPEVAGSLTLLNGSVSQVGVNVSKINKPIGEIVYLQSLGLDVELKPSLQATGSVGLTAGPKVLGAAAAELNGSLTLQLGPSVALSATGSLKMVTMDVASASLRAAIPGGVSFSGDMHRGFPGFDVDAHIGGSIDAKSFEAQGGATAQVGPVSARGDALVDQLGVAACASGSALGKTVNVGGGYKWKSGNTGLLEGACGFDDLRKTIAHLSATGPAAVDVPSGQRQVNLIVKGAAGTAPTVVLSRGGAQVTVVPGTVGRLGNTVYLAVADAQDGETGIIMAQPPAGKVTVAPTPGGPSVSVTATALLPSPKVRVKVRSLGHRRYKMTWNALRIPGQELLFRETSGAAAKTLRRTRASHGSVTFAALDTASAKHVIQVVVDQGGLPREVLRTAARFRVARAVMGRPRVSIRQKGAKATIRWTRVPNAATYQVTVTTADGRRLFFSRKSSARTLTIPGSTTVHATVRGVSAGAVAGPARTAVNRRR